MFRHIVQENNIHLYLLIQSTRDVNRIPIKLKLVSGSYIFQNDRAKFNQNDVNPACLLCNEAPETLEHFLLNCLTLESTRQAVLNDVCLEYERLTGKLLNIQNTEYIIHILLDCSVIIDTIVPTSGRKIRKDDIVKLEFHSRRLLYNLHSSRYRLLSKVKLRKR